MKASGRSKRCLKPLQGRFGWDRVEEEGKIIGLTKDGANVSLEPGGALELSGAPLGDDPPDL